MLKDNQRQSPPPLLYLPAWTFSSQKQYQKILNSNKDFPIQFMVVAANLLLAQEQVGNSGTAALQGTPSVIIPIGHTFT